MLSRKLLFAPQTPQLLKALRNFSVKQHNSSSSDSDAETLQRLTHKDWLSPTQVLKTIKNIKNPNNLVPALQQYKTRRDYKPSEHLFTLLINRLSEAKLFDNVDNLMLLIDREMGGKGGDSGFVLSEEFYYNVMKVYGLRAGRISKVIDTLFGMRDIGGGVLVPSVKSLNFVLNLLVNKRMFEFVHEVYIRGCRVGIQVDACCLNILVKGLCKAGDFEGAVRVLDEFPNQGCRSNARTFSTLMHGLCERGRVDEAFRVFKRMEREGVEADTVVYNVLISGLRKQGRFDEGVELLGRMKAKGCCPNWGSYQEVLYGLIDAEKFDEAKELMGRMMADGIGPSFLSYKLMIHGLCKLNMLEDVDWVLKEMAQQGFVPRMGMWKRIVYSLFSAKSASIYAPFDDLVTNCCS